MLRIISVMSLVLLLAGCSGRKETEQSLFYNDGTPKPIVAFVPLIDHSDHDLPWDLSEELTQGLKEKLLQKEKLFLVTVPKKQAQASEENNPFGPDISWMKTIYPRKDFVVFMELIEHKEVPLYPKSESSPEESPAELKTSLRVRVVDLRGNEARVILQELVHDTQYIPKQFTRYNLFQVPWGREMYGITPLGLAHAKLAKEVAARIEDYILENTSTY